MHLFVHRSRCLLLAVLTAGVLLLAGCGVDEESLAGVWEGRSPDTSYVFSLQPDGKGRVRITNSVRTVNYACNWSVNGNRLRLSRERGASTSFRIVDQSANELALRVGSGLGGVCRLQRTSLR